MGDKVVWRAGVVCSHPCLWQWPPPLAPAAAAAAPCRSRQQGAPPLLSQYTIRAAAGRWGVRHNTTWTQESERETGTGGVYQGGGRLQGGGAGLTRPAGLTGCSSRGCGGSLRVNHTSCSSWVGSRAPAAKRGVTTAGGMGLLGCGLCGQRQGGACGFFRPREVPGGVGGVVFCGVRALPSAQVAALCHRQALM